MARVVRELRPRLVLVENVPGLLTRGLGVVVHELALAGYVGRWFTLGAVDVGAPHRRERVFVIARRADASRVEPLLGGHASGLLRDDGWFSPQESLFDSSPLLRLGKRGRWTLDAVYEDDPRLAVDDQDSGALLPTPDASLFNDGQSVEAYLERKDREIAKGYNGNGGGTPLAMAVRLLPTPGASDSTGAEDETRKARQDAGKTGGPSLRDLPNLLPTPAARDGKGVSARGDRHDGYERSESDGCLPNAVRLLPTPVANPENPGSGGELRAALEHGPGRRNETGIDSLGRPNAGRPSRKLLPTPQKSDGDGGRLDRNPETVATGKRPSGSKASVPLATAIDGIGEGDLLLPTPKANVHRASRRAMVDTQQWASPQLEQVAEMASGELPREFDSWDEVPGSSGAMRDAGGGGDIKWGVYEPAVRRWENVLGREAPAPTDEKGRLAPEFVEWLMGFDDGWTDVGISRTARLRLLGNAVHVLVGARVALAAVALDRQLSPESSPACA